MDYQPYQETGKAYLNKSYNENKVKEVKMYLVNEKKATSRLRGVNKINNYGVTFHRAYFDKSGNQVSRTTTDFIDSLRFSKQITINKDSFTTTNLFDDKGRLIEVKNFKNDNKARSTNKYQYDENGKQSLSAFYNKNGIETERYEYTYYENGSRKETKFYKKNKLKKVYNYACEPTGTVEKKVSQQTICKKRTYNPDSSYFEIYEGKDNKGHSYRRVSKFTMDSLCTEETFFNNNNKEGYKYLYVYENRKTKSISVYNKGKISRTYVYSYTPEGLTTGYKAINAKGKIMNNIKYEYSYF
jgi:hypothetical protein